MNSEYEALELIIRLYDEKSSSFRRWLADELEMSVRSLPNVIKGVREVLISVEPSSLSQVLEGSALEEVLGIEDEKLFIEDDRLKPLYQAIDKLPKRTREIIIMRFGLYGTRARALEEVAQFHNLTRERIRQIEGIALDYLRTECPELKALLSEREE